MLVSLPSGRAEALMTSVSISIGCDAVSHGKDMSAFADLVVFLYITGVLCTDQMPSLFGSRLF